MNVNNVYLTMSAVSPAQYPNDKKIEIAFVGRSNVGKSSLINKLINRKRLAHTSSKPGKTRTINFYNVEDMLYFVDLPGYGFTKTSKKEKNKWGSMIEEYLTSRDVLKCIILLIDSRHKPTKDDIMMLDWIKYYGYKIIVIATKFDKLSNKNKIENLKIISESLELNNDILIPFSAETGEGKEKIWQIINDVVNQ